MKRPVKKKIRLKGQSERILADADIIPKKSLVHHWFQKRFRVLSFSVLLMAGLLRLALLMELPQMPFNQLHKAPDLDMNFFDLWGDRIANGDVLTDTIWHPYHFWHKAIAKSYGLQTDLEGKKKWNEWYGGKKYHQEPMYALIIGLAKWISGEGRLLVYILQMLLSLVSIWMIMWLGRHYFSVMAGIIGGLLFTFYGPGLLFDATLIRTSFSTTILLACIVLGEQLIMGKRKAWLMGCIGGAGYLLMTTTILLWLPLVTRWVYLRREDISQLWKVAIPFFIFFSFLILRNSIADSPLLSSSSVGPITYILSNFTEYKPELGFVYFNHAGEIMEASGGKMIPAALGVIRRYDSIWGWVLLQFKKLGALFHWYEIPNNVNTYLAAEFSHTLKITFIPYSIIAALGVAGMFLNFRNKKTMNLFIGILSQVSIMVVFYVLCRFRVPMTAMLCVFAGYSIHQLAFFDNLKRSLFILFGICGLWLLIMRPVPEILSTYTKGDLNTYFNIYYQPQLDELSSKGDIGGCIVLVEELLKGFPTYAKDARYIHKADNSFKRDVVYYSGLVHRDLGKLYQESGNEAKAIQILEKSEMLLAEGAK